MDALAGAGEEMTTAAVAEAICYPRNTAGRALDDLVAHGVVAVNRHGQGKATTWQLADWAAESYHTATSPETSGEAGSASPETSGEAPLPACTHAEDKSGKVGETPNVAGLLSQRIRAIARLPADQQESAMAALEAETECSL
jgi:hypothetical protein